MNTYLILGSSAAGLNAARELRLLDQDSKIIMAAKDRLLFSRCILHHYIEGIRNEEEMRFAGPDVIQKHNIDFRPNYEAQSIDENKKEVHFINGEIISYDKLLIATGSSSFIPPVEGLREGKQIRGLKNFEDAEFIKENIKKLKRVAIIGSGLIGMDALEALVKGGCETHLIDMSTHLLNLQLDQRTADTYLDAFKKYGVQEHFGTLAKKVHLDDDNNVQKLELDNGEIFDVDLIVVATGNRANISFLEGSSLETSKFGLIFDEYGKTNVEDIYGAGDVSGIHPIWPMAVKEGIVAAHNMVGEKLIMDDMFSSKTTMNFLGIPTMSLGEHTPKENINDYEILIHEDGDTYRKLVLKDGLIVGAIIQGKLDYSGVLTQLIKRKIKVTYLDRDIFDINYSEFFELDDAVEYHYKSQNKI